MCDWVILKNPFIWVPLLSRSLLAFNPPRSPSSQMPHARSISKPTSFLIPEPKHNWFRWSIQVSPFYLQPKKLSLTGYWSQTNLFVSPFGLDPCLLSNLPDLPHPPSSCPHHLETHLLPYSWVPPSVSIPACSQTSQISPTPPYTGNV